MSTVSIPDTRSETKTDVHAVPDGEHGGEEDLSPDRVAGSAGAAAPHLFTLENAKAMGAAGGRKAQENRALKREDPEAYLQKKLSQSRVELVDALINASLGRGAFHDLASGERLKALVKALEYAVGKPGAQAKAAADPTSEDTTPGLSIV